MEASQVLGIKPNASKEEIRRAFKRALLDNHPDTAKTLPAYTIDQVNRAYRQLCDPQLEPKQALQVQFTEICDLSELEFDEQTEVFSKPCRCGQDICLFVSDLEANGDADEIAVQCTGCSLWVLVQYDTEES